MPATGAAVRWNNEPEPGPAPAAGTPRTALYGGLVGEMLGEIEQRLHEDGFAAAPATEGPDGFHRLSVASGYVALAAGSAATVLGVMAIF